jgi:hypothetical protein
MSILPSNTVFFLSRQPEYSFICYIVNFVVEIGGHELFYNNNGYQIINNKKNEKIVFADNIAINRNGGIFPARERKANTGYYEFQIGIGVLQSGYEIL